MILALVLNPLAILAVFAVFLVVVWASRALLKAFGIGDPVETVVYVVLVVLFLLWLLAVLGVSIPGVRVGA